MATCSKLIFKCVCVFMFTYSHVCLVLSVCLACVVCFVVCVCCIICRCVCLFGRALGHGAFGEVYQGILLDTAHQPKRCPVAIKVTKARATAMNINVYSLIFIACRSSLLCA